MNENDQSIDRRYLFASLILMIMALAITLSDPLIATQQGNWQIGNFQIGPNWVISDSGPSPSPSPTPSPSPSSSPSPSPSPIPTPSPSPNIGSLSQDPNRVILETVQDFIWTVRGNSTVIFQNDVVDLDKFLNLTVLDGTFNGTGNLIMHMDSGVLNINANTNSTLELSSSLNCQIYVNINVYSVTSGPVSITQGQTYQISWRWVVYVPFEFAWIFIGMIGIFLMIFGTIFGAYKMKHGEFAEGIGWALILFVIGLGLLIAWLSL
jgi:hypothetical protein